VQKRKIRNVAMTWKTWLYLHKYNLLKPGSIAYFKRLMAYEKMSRDELEDLHWKKVFSLIRHAVFYSKFYREKLKKIGANIEDFTTPEAFDAFPVLTRDELQEHFDEILCDNTSRSALNLSTTGGSSGQPAAVFMPKAFPRAALGWRMLSWWGLEPAVNWSRTYRNTAPGLKEKIIQGVVDFPIKTVLLNASSFTESDIVVFLDRFNKKKPPLLQGYVGAIDNVAEYILAHKLNVHKPEAVWVTSAPLSEIQRARIEKAFHSPVYDQYGCCEVFWLAAECQAHKGLHIFYDARRIDFLGDDLHSVQVGQLGKIAITDLENYSFPIIRYLNDDMGRLLTTRCGCGCSLPLMDHVRGRISDSIHLPSGRCLNGEFMTTLFDRHPDAIKRFHVHQNKDFSIVVKVVPNCCEELMKKILQEIVQDLKHNTFNEVEITTKIVLAIDLIKGKLRFVTSDCK